MSLDPPTRLDPPLAGWTVGLLRVDGGRSALARALARTGSQVLALPTLSLRAVPDAGQARAELESLGHAAAWIFVSPAAVRFAWRAWPEFALSSAARVFAVGPGTAKSLARRGVPAIYPRQRHDSEGLLALVELGDIAGTVALVKAPGGRALLADGLRKRGLRVREVAVYHRGPARWDRRHRARLDALLRAPPRALLLATSGEALTALAKLAGSHLDAVLR
ncbi:MAG: uroporphyrinogen-III synthase, partial [Lysobacterales bacterium]